MKKLTDNPLLLWSLIILGVYWTAGYSLPGHYWSAFMSFLALAGGMAGLIRFGPRAYDIVVNGARLSSADSARIGEGAEASHLSVYGFALLSLGAVYSSLYVLIWIMAGAPPSWSNTPISSFSRLLFFSGFALVAISPSMSAQGLRVPSSTWLAMLAAVVALAIFFFGVRVGFYQAEIGDYNLLPDFITRPVIPMN